MFRLTIALILSILILACNNEAINEIPEEQLCDNGSFIGDVLLTSQLEVDDFGAQCYSAIEGNLSIGTGTISNDIVSLAALSSLTSVSEVVNISNTHVQNLNGLENLNDVEVLGIRNNPELTIINGFANLQNVGAFIMIDDNQSLELISDFNSLTANDGTFIQIKNNPILVEIQGFDNISSEVQFQVENNELLSVISACSGISILKSLLLADNPILTDLSGFNNLTTLNNLRIINCSAIEDLSGFQNLENIGYLSGQGGSLDLLSNDNLSSLDGLENVTSLSTISKIRIGVDFNGNPLPNAQLTDFCGLENLFQNGSFNSDNVFIEHNGFNPTYQDIINGNCSL